MTTLDKPTFDAIVTLLVLRMDAPPSRRAFVTQALYDAPMLIQQISYDGNAHQFTVNLVRACDDFGQIAPGRLAVVALLEQLREQVGQDTQQEIERIVGAIVREHTATPQHEGRHAQDTALIHATARELRWVTVSSKK